MGIRNGQCLKKPVKDARCDIMAVDGGVLKLQTVYQMSSVFPSLLSWSQNAFVSKHQLPIKETI